MNKTEQIEHLKYEIELLTNTNFIIKENQILKKLLFEHAVLLFNLKESCQEKRK